MSGRYSKTHIRRKSEPTDVEHVSVDETGLTVTVSRPDWSAPRPFKFHFLTSFVALSLAQTIALAFGHFAARFARPTAVRRYQVFKLVWCAVAALHESSSVARNLRTGRLAKWWSNAIHDHLVGEFDRANKETSAKVAVQSVETVFGELASCGLVADVAKVEPPKNLHLRKVPRPGLFELSAKGKQPSAEELSELIRHFRDIGVPVEDKEAEAYIELLATVLTPQERKDPKKVAEAYLKQSQAHLSALTNAAEDEYLKWSRHYEKGQELLKLADPAVLAAFKAGHFARKSATDFKRFFPKHDDAVTTANLLLLIRDRFNGVVPASESLPAPFGTRFQKAVSRIGGVYALDAMLTLHRNGTAAAAFLYMIDTGANLSTTCSLEVEFDRPTSEPGIVEFFAVKARANYAAIYDVLPVNQPGRKISTVKALRGVVAMTRQLHDNFANLGKSLFIFRFFLQPSIASGEFFANQLSYLLKSHALPVGWLLSGIRTAVGVSDALDPETGTLTRLQRRLNQKSRGVTERYALHWPVRKSLELDTANYQELFQIGIAANLQGAFEWLDKSPEEAARLVEEAKRKGLGFLLPANHAGDESDADQNGKLQPDLDSQHDETYVFVTDEQSLTEVIATKMSLDANFERLQTESTARFNELWIELLAFVTAVIAEAKRSQFAYLIPRAQRAAEHLIAAGFDITELRL